MLEKFDQNLNNYPKEYPREYFEKALFDPFMTFNNWVKKLYDIIIDMKTFKLYFKKQHIDYKELGAFNKWAYGKEATMLNYKEKEIEQENPQKLWYTFFYYLLRVHFHNSHFITKASPEIVLLKELFCKETDIKIILIKTTYKSLFKNYGFKQIYSSIILEEIDSILEGNPLITSRQFNAIIECYIKDLFLIIYGQPLFQVTFHGSRLVLSEENRGSFKVRLELITFIFITMHLSMIIKYGKLKNIHEHGRYELAPVYSRAL